MYAPYIRTILRFLSKIKVNYSLKRSYQSITQSINVEHQLIERILTRKMFWGAFHASRIEKEIKK